MDLIDRQAAIDTLDKHLRTTDVPVSYPGIISALTEWLNELPSAQAEIVRCKDCKHWKDSDGVYRRGIGAESKCPVNIRAVYEGNFYCADAERRTDEA